MAAARALRGALLGLGRALSRSTAGRPAVTVLAYHSVSDAADPVSVPAELFRRQLEWLTARYAVVSLEEALRGPAPGPRPPVVLTFDDGYEDFLTAAWPVLEAFAAPATVYVVTGHLEGGKPFAFRAGAGKRSLDVAQVQELHATGLVTVGSHTHTHRNLAEESGPGARADLVASRAFLAECLGLDRVHFCYPWALRSSASAALVKSLFASAAIGRGGRNPLPVDPWSLRRIPIKRASLDDFADRLAGATVVEDELRDAWNGLRARLRRRRAP